MKELDKLVIEDDTNCYVLDDGWQAIFFCRLPQEVF